MPLTEIELSDTNAVFAEIKRSYGQQRFWTVGDLSYTPPGETWLAGTRPARPRAGAAAPPQYEVQLEVAQGVVNRLTVFIVWTGTTGQIRTIVGSIVNT
jgi:hypothetical protein